MTWDDFLRLLEEGQIVLISVPMNHVSQKIMIGADVPTLQQVSQRLKFPTLSVNF